MTLAIIQIITGAMGLGICFMEVKHMFKESDRREKAAYGFSAILFSLLGGTTLWLGIYFLIVR